MICPQSRGVRLSLFLLFFIAYPASGQFSVTPVYPSLCTASQIAFSSTKVMPTGSFVVDGDFGNAGSVWNFTASNKLVLSDFGSGGQNVSSHFITNKDGSVSFTVPSGGWFDGAPITGEAEPAGVNPAYPACGSQPVVSSSTTSSSSAMTWTTGACSLTTLDPTKTLTCASSTITPYKETGCACPDKNVYMLLNNAAGSNCDYTTGQGDLEIGIQTACPTVDASTSTSTSSVPPCETKTAAAASFTLTVTSQIPCDEQVADACNGSSTPSLTTGQWGSYHVDDFWKAWNANNSASIGGNKNMQALFFTEFSGGHESQTNASGTNCEIDYENFCHALSDCSDYKTNSNPGYEIQGLFVWNALINLSQTLNFIWMAVQGAKVIWDSIQVGFGGVFLNYPPGTKWTLIFDVINSLLTLFAVVFIFLDITVTSTAVALLIGTATAFGGAANIFNALNPPSTESPQVDQIAKDETVANTFFDSITTPMQTIHDTWMNDGTNITELLSGGIWLNGGAELSTVTTLADAGGPNNTADLARSGSLTNASAYFADLVVTNLINNYFKSSGAFVYYVPYGNDVLGFDFPQTSTTFTQQDCQNNFINAAAQKNQQSSWNDSVIAECLPGGLGVLMSPGDVPEEVSWWQKTFFLYDDYNQIRYDPADMLKSSTAGFLANGFNYNLTQDLGAQVTSPNFNPSTLEQLTIVNPSSGGVYNLPVCSASDLSGIPWCLRLAPNDNSCQVTQCPCGSDRANITVNNKPTQYFKDFALPAVLTAFAAAPNTAAQIKDSVCPLNTHSGYGRKRDLDGIVGRRLTHPEDVENAAMWDIVS